MVWEEAVHGRSRGVVIELVVVDPDRIAVRAGIAEQVVVAVAGGDLDGVAGHVESSVAVDVGRAAWVDARVAVAIRLAVGDEAVVGGEGEDPVLGVPATDDLVDDETVGLDDVNGVEGGALGGEVAQVEAVGSIALMTFSFWNWASKTTSAGDAPVPSICRSLMPRMPTRFCWCGHCFCCS